MGCCQRKTATERQVQLLMVVPENMAAGGAIDSRLLLLQSLVCCVTDGATAKEF